MTVDVADPTDSNAGFIEGIGILVAVVIIVIVTAGINYNKDAQFRGLQKQMADQYKCSVVRSGTVVQLSTLELVVGDICLVEYGEFLVVIMIIVIVVIIIVIIIIIIIIITALNLADEAAVQWIGALCIS